MPKFDVALVVLKLIFLTSMICLCFLGRDVSRYLDECIAKAKFTLGYAKYTFIYHNSLGQIVNNTILLTLCKQCCN